MAPPRTITSTHLAVDFNDTGTTVSFGTVINSGTIEGAPGQRPAASISVRAGS